MAPFDEPIPAPPIRRAELSLVEPEKENPQQRRKVVMKTRVQTRVENWELPKLSLIEDPPATRVKN